MNGKDLVLVLFAAAAAGAGGGLAAALVAQPAADPAPAAEREAQLARIETALGRISGDQEEARKSVATLQERVTALQMDVGTARREMAEAADRDADAETVARPGRARRPEALEIAAAVESLKDAAARRDHLGTHFQTHLADIARSGQVTDALAKRLEGVSSGIRLRLLPEEKRWDEARSDLGLNDGQVDALRRAIAERDVAIQGAMAVETSGEGTEQQITIKRMDPAKAAAAQQDYDRKVASTLDQDQKAKWDRKGYGHAFGGSPGGGLAIIHTVDVNVESGDADGK
jgi:hypothetical protein